MSEAVNRNRSGGDPSEGTTSGPRGQMSGCPHLSVVLPCYNGAATIGVQLDALAGQQWDRPWEVIVADNRSSDRSMEIVRGYEGLIPGLRIVDASGRQGQPYALNVGVLAAQAPLVALCDSDDEVAPGWVAGMAAALECFSLVGCRFETKKLNPEWVARSRPNPQERDIQSYTYPAYLRHTGGGGMGFRKEVFDLVGGFDEAFPLLHDTDFCWRAQLAGFELGFAGDAVLHVRFRQDLSGMFRQAKGYAEYNVLLYKKYRSRGMPLLDWKVGVRHWLRLFRDARYIRSKADFARWYRKFGWQIGRTKASLKYRVVAL